MDAVTVMNTDEQIADSCCNCSGDNWYCSCSGYSCSYSWNDRCVFVVVMIIIPSEIAEMPTNSICSGFVTVLVVVGVMFLDIFLQL